MALEVRGVPVLSQGEFIRLTRGLRKGYTGSGALQALWAGEDLPRGAVYAAFNVGARMAAETDDARELIDLACERIERGFPDVEFSGRPRKAGGEVETSGHGLR